MPDVSGLYPQPPQQQPQGSSLLSNPAQAVGIMNGLQEYGIRNQQAPALVQQPQAQLDQVRTAIQTARQIQQAEAQHRVAAGLGAMIPDGAKSDDVHSAAAYFARSNPDITSQYPDMIPAAADLILQHPKGIAAGRSILLNSALSPGEASGRVAGPPTAGGAPTTISVPQANLGGSRGIVTGQPVGEETTQTGSAQAALRLENTGATSAQYHADLENLKQDSEVLDNLGGPTIDVERKLNALTTRLGNFGVTMTPEQMKAADSFSKIANQISLNQASAMAGTDAGRDMTLHANPSMEATRYGRDGVIDMLQGNQDAVDTTRKLWFQAKKNGAPASSYHDFVNTLGGEPLNKSGAKFDPRVFQFNRMSRDNQQKFLGQVGPENIGQFESNYKEAIARGWVKPLKKADATQPK